MAAGCGSDESTHELEGTWELTGPEPVGQTRMTWHSFHDGGSVASNSNILDSESGCRWVWTLVGTYRTSDGVLDIEYTSGTSETAHCTDGAANVAESPYDADTLAAFETSIEYTLDGDTLNFVGEGVTFVLTRVTG